MILGLTPHDLTQMPDVLSVSTPLGLVIGGLVGFFWRSHTDAAFVQNVAAGATFGSIVGALLGFAVSLAALAAGA